MTDKNELPKSYQQRSLPGLDDVEDDRDDVAMLSPSLKKGILMSLVAAAVVLVGLVLFSSSTSGPEKNSARMELFGRKSSAKYARYELCRIFSGSCAVVRCFTVTYFTLQKRDS
jgi:hypothetical protein